MADEAEYLIAWTGLALQVLKRTGLPLSELLPLEGARVTISHPAHPVTTRLFGESTYCVECEGKPVPCVVPQSCLEVVDGET